MTTRIALASPHPKGDWRNAYRRRLQPMYLTDGYQDGHRVMRVDISRVAGTEDIPLPAYQTEGASGMDLLAAVTEPTILEPNERTAIPTGIMIAIPDGYEAQVRARSGWAKKFGICLTNGIGTIDVDFRGEVHVLLSNLGQEPFTIHRGDRIAQLVVTPVMRVQWNVVEELPTTERGVGGFGHTGRQ